jgi:hypothetical protein
MIFISGQFSWDLEDYGPYCKTMNHFYYNARTHFLGEIKSWVVLSSSISGLLYEVNKNVLYGNNVCLPYCRSSFRCLIPAPKLLDKYFRIHHWRIILKLAGQFRFSDVITHKIIYIVTDFLGALLSGGPDGRVLAPAPRNSTVEVFPSCSCTYRC